MKLLSGALSLGLLVVLTQNACVTKPVNDQEVSSRSSTIPYEIYYEEASRPPQVGFTALDAAGRYKGAQWGGWAFSQGHAVTDAMGKRWDRATGTINLSTGQWYANTDASHPNAKWKTRLSFVYAPYMGGERYGRTTASITFAGNPDGSLSTGTTHCMTSLQSQGGVVVATTCGNGDTVSIYATGD